MSQLFSHFLDLTAISILIVRSSKNASLRRKRRKSIDPLEFDGDFNDVRLEKLEFFVHTCVFFYFCSSIMYSNCNLMQFNATPSIFNHLRRMTHRLKATSTLKRIMYMTCHNYVHHVHHVQDTHFELKSRVEKWDLRAGNLSRMSLLGTSKQLGVGE